MHKIVQTDLTDCMLLVPKLVLDGERPVSMGIPGNFEHVLGLTVGFSFGVACSESKGSSALVVARADFVKKLCVFFKS